MVSQVLHSTPSRKGTRVDLRNLREWRLAKLMSQDELAARASVAKTTIIRLENQEKRQFANLVTVAKLATGLGISREQLAYGEPTITGVVAPYDADPKDNRAA